ncbi:MAG: DNA/RNA nuclease SfsA [Candidatus Bathyarchaeota archaeon]|nr:DNA/RNA nuclease SfsA [Candidatus Bathyarchaeota archaeon]
MKHPSTPLKATLLERPNRFLGVVELNGEKTLAHIPNPGRMHELMVPGTTVYVLEKQGDHRKTGYDLTLVEYAGTLVSIDSRLPNKLLAEAITQDELQEFSGYRVNRMEPSYLDSRLDLLLTDSNKQAMVEAKSCTLVEDGIALFPDAPTKRGARHMNTLVKALKDGRSAVCFIIQRGDAKEFRPNEAMDPIFAEALRNAGRKGVEIYAYTSEITFIGASIRDRIPVNLD